MDSTMRSADKICCDHVACNRILDEARAEAGRLREAVQTISDWAHANHGGSKTPAEVWPRLTAALAAAEGLLIPTEPTRSEGCACGVTTEHGPHEFDTEPESMQWTITDYPDPPFDMHTLADEIVAWINFNGGEARYEPGVASPPGRSNHFDRILIRTADDWVYALPGDTIVMGNEWFDAPHHHSGTKRVREFRVVRGDG